MASICCSPPDSVLAYAFIYAQPHHHYLGTIDPSRPELRPLFDSAKHFLDYSWSPDGSTILLQIDESDEWVYVAARSGSIIRRSTPGGWHPDWCRCASTN